MTLRSIIRNRDESSAGVARLSDFGARFDCEFFLREIVCRITPRIYGVGNNMPIIFFLSKSVDD